MLESPNFKLIYGQVNSVKFIGEKTLDDDMTTYFQSHVYVRYKKPFLLFDFLNPHTINGVIAIRKHSPSSDFITNVYVTIENIPNTDYLPNANFCYENKTDIEVLSWFAIVISCTKIYSGRFLLLHQYKPSNPDLILSFAEIRIFGKKTSSLEIEGIFFILCQFSFFLNSFLSNVCLFSIRDFL